MGRPRRRRQPAQRTARQYGHRVYVDRDLRSDYLLGRIPTVAESLTQAQTVAVVVDAAALLGLPAPNVDFGLAALAYVMNLEPDAANNLVGSYA